MTRAEFVQQYVIARSIDPDPQWCPCREQVLQWALYASIIYGILESKEGHV